MAVTNRGTKWELRNSIQFFSLLFPIANAVPFFNISRRVDDEKLRKRWVKMGSIFLIVSIILSVFFILSGQDMFVGLAKLPEYQQQSEGAPSVTDYLGDDYESKYEDYMSTKEYSQYQKDYKKYTHTKEYLQADQKNSNLKEFIRALEMLFITLYIVWAVVVFVIGVNERTRYLRWLANRVNMMDAAASLKDQGDDVEAMKSAVKKGAQSVKSAVQSVQQRVAPKQNTNEPAQQPVQSIYQMPNQPQQPAKQVQQPVQNATWVCSCGSECVGNFCANCGQQKPAQQPAPSAPAEDGNNTGKSRRMLEI